MEKPGFKAVLLVSLFLMLFSIRGHAEPMWSNPTNVTPSNYDSNFISEFNVTWDNNISSVLIEGNWSGIFENYTMENYTYGGSIYDYSVILPAGTFCWNFWANDTNSNWNYTDKTDWCFTIGKADNPVYLYFNNGTDYLNQNITINYGTLINVTGSATEGIISIFRDDEDVTLENSQNIILGVKESGYEYRVNATGNQNYSDNSTALTYFIFVNKANPTVTLLIDGESDNVTVDRNWSVNFTAYSDIPYVNLTLYTNLTGWVNQTNITAVYNLTKLTHLDVYEVAVYIFANENYSANNVTYYLSVEDIAPQHSNSISVYPPHNSQYEPDKFYQFNITWKDGSLDNVTFNIRNITSLDANPINITFNSVLNYTKLINYTIDDNTKIFSINITNLPAGTYDLFWTAIDDFNNQSSIHYTYTVDKKNIASDIILSLDPSSLPSGGGSVKASCSALAYPVNLTLYFEDFPSNTSNKGETVYLTGSLVQTTDVFCLVSGNANYTGSRLNSVIVASPIITSSTPASTGTSTGSFLIKDLTSGLTITAGESKSTSFTLSNTLENNMQNVNISVSGISSEWYTLSTNSISLLKRNVIETVTITFNIPETAEAKTYDITITAKGKPLVGSTRTTSKTMKLTVKSPVIQTIEAPEEIEEITIENSAQENITSNETVETPTGLAATFEYMKNNLVIILAIASCLLIFIFRNNVTTAFMKAGGRKAPKAEELPKIKMPPLSRYRLTIGLKRRGRKAKPLEEPKEMKRPEVLDREIKRDIKELQNVLEAEKKMEKKKKKFNLDNN